MNNPLSNLAAADVKAWLTYLGMIGLLLILLLIFRKIYSVWYILKQETVILELTPPSRGDKTPEATNQLFQSIYGLNSTRSFFDKVLHRNISVALEIVATKKDGIRYLIRVSKKYSLTVEHIVSSYTPDIKVNRVKDYTAHSGGRVLEFSQSTHFAYPLQAHDLLESHDPISYITNAMTKLEPQELMSFQLLITPIRNHRADLLRRKILINDSLASSLGKREVNFFHGTSRLVNGVLFGVLDIFSSAYHTQTTDNYRSQSKDVDYKAQVAKGIKPARTLSYFEHELVESMSEKLKQPLFSTDIRVLIKVKTKREFYERKNSIESALSLYSAVKYQSLSLRKIKHHLLRQYSRFAFIHRLPSLMKNHSSVLSVSEVAGLYHFPHTISAKTENVVKSLSKTLPAPISLKGTNKLDILLGENNHQGTITPIGLTEAERERHIYILGGTGNGKTTMILYGIVQDIQNGKGVAVIDPHGDLAETILRHIPEERIKDVIYLNPDDLARPIGINLLELPEGLKGDELLREKDLVTESTISVMRKIFSEDDSGGHRIEYILRNTIQTALTLEGATLFTIFRLLNDGKYRKDIVNRLEDDDLRNFWKNELGKAGDFQKVKMAAGITAKIGRFLFSASAKRILEQEKSTINFDDIINEKKILICNFSKGLLGEDTSSLFGTTVLAKLQVASLRRARQKQIERTPYYLYVDEFQNFATMSFVQMLSEARKYKLFLTMAEQSTSQQDEQRLVDIILANVGTVICFRSGSPADERFVLPLFFPYIEQGEIANLPSFSFYARIAAIQSQEPMSGITLLLEDVGSETGAQRAINCSRDKYGTTLAKKEAILHNEEPQIIPRKKSKKRSRIIRAQSSTLKIG